MIGIFFTMIQTQWSLVSVEPVERPAHLSAGCSAKRMPFTKNADVDSGCCEPTRITIKSEPHDSCTVPFRRPNAYDKKNKVDTQIL